MFKALLIDHHDSFTYNIKAWLQPRFDVFIVNYDQVHQISLIEYDLIIISPGPKTPADYPLTKKFLENVPANKPVLGICLGLQMMNEVENGTVSEYYPPLHGKSSRLMAQSTQFDNLNVARYHSLRCHVAECFETIATSEEIPMIVRHKNKNWLGMQFHPESFLTEKPEIFLQAVVDLCSP